MFTLKILTTHEIIKAESINGVKKHGDAIKNGIPFFRTGYNAAREI